MLGGSGNSGFSFGNRIMEFDILIILYDVRHMPLV